MRLWGGWPIKCKGWKGCGELESPVSLKYSPSPLWWKKLDPSPLAEITEYYRVIIIIQWHLVEFWSRMSSQMRNTVYQMNEWIKWQYFFITDCFLGPTGGTPPKRSSRSQETNRLQNSRFFLSKSVQKSVKRGVRVLRARNAWSSQARIGQVGREKKTYL